MKRVILINGPNLNLIGTREPEKYGEKSFEDIMQELNEFAGKNGIMLDYFQSNNEGDIIDKIHAAANNFDYIIINPGALTHYSYSIHDALLSVKLPAIEVHITNIFARENWRQKSVISSAVSGVISGLGTDVYLIALIYISKKLSEK
jgi:3-dehydroquinate dehydratase-2